MSTALKRLPAFAALLTAFAAVAPPPSGAQEVQYSTITKVDLGSGMMNAIMRRTGASEVKETAYIKGKKLRSDTEDQTIIFDLDKSQYILIDRKQRTYTVVPLADMATVATSAMRGMKAEASKDQLKGSAVDSAGNKADFTVDVKVDPTGERKKINDNDAERVIVTMETDVKVTPQGEAQQDAGKLVIVMDTWNAKTGPASDAVRAWEQAASKEIAAAAFGGRANMGPAFGTNPQMSEAMKKAREEAQKIEGIAVLSTTHLVIVAPGQKFDRALALKDADAAASGQEQRRGGLRGMIGRAMEQSNRQQQEQKGNAPQQTQGTLAKITTQILDVRTPSPALTDSWFEPPADYREVKVQAPPSTPK